MGYQNFFASRLASDAGASDTVLTLESVPSKTSGRLVLEARNPTQREIISYSGVAGSTITGVVRGLGGTSAKSHTKTALIEMNLTAEDVQDLYDAFQSFSATNNDWRSMVATLSVATGYNKGNKEAVIDSSVDYTSILSPGMRLRFNRGTAPQTQCATFVAASSQYGSKASPTGVAPSSALTAEAWIYVDTIKTSGEAAIISRDSGVSGFYFSLDSGGRPQLVIRNATSTLEYIRAYQSIPTGRWVHVAAYIDISTDAGKIYIDGADVPALYSSGGLSSITNAGNLQVAASNSTNFFDGKISDARLWSGARTATQIRDNMNQQLTGSESGLMFYAKLSGNWNDSTANANNLTANGGAVATTNANPFNSTEYAIITKVTSSQITVYTGTDFNVPNMSISSPAYSSQKAPFGFPTSAEKWKVIVPMITQYGVANNSGVISLKHAISVPLGEWRLGYSFNAMQTAASSITQNTRYALDTVSAGTPSSADLLTTSGTIVSATEFYPRLSAYKSVALTAQTWYYLNAHAIGTNLTGHGVWGQPGYLEALCAYV